MANVYLKNLLTNWQSQEIDLNSAMVLLGSQTLDQAKNWFVLSEDDGNQWKNILDSKVIMARLKNMGPIQQSKPKTPTNIPMTPQKVELNQPPSIEIPFPVAVDVGLNSALKEDLVGEANDVELPTEFFSPDLIQENTVFKTQPPAPPVSEPVATKSGSEKRLHPRFEIRLRVIVKSGKNTYMTFTQDVSLGGICLLNDVPEYIFNSEAEIYITAPDNKNNIMFKCMPVPSKLGKSRLMFTQIDASKQKLLATWLQHFVKPNAQKVS